MRDLYVARRSGAVMLPDGNGVPRRHAIQRGVTVAEKGSAMLERHGKLFEPMKVHYPATRSSRREAAPVETMTAAPGERREVQPTATVYHCDQCEATAKSPAGLAAHKRSHAATEPEGDERGE